jgi:hypothetical protein
MALANKALAHFLVLVSFMSTFCKSNPSQFVHGVKTLHEVLEGPDFLGIQKVLEVRDNALGLVDSDIWVLEEVNGSGGSGLREL